MKRKTKNLLNAIVVGALVLSVAACRGAATFVLQHIDVRQNTYEKLDIHYSLCPRVPVDMKTAKIVFFSDLHRGMGKRDVFKNNKGLFREILQHYYDRGYTLVLVGDIEEGWAFQPANIPLIRKAHQGQLDIEKQFYLDNRYYRLYGNHDDFYRANPVQFDEETAAPVYPAVIFTDRHSKFKIFVTHGHQGHILHDAGDMTASWGVYVKYNWLLEILARKPKSESALIKQIKKTWSALQRHESIVYQWAKSKTRWNSLQKFNILVTGHTHIPVFESHETEHMYDVILNDIEDRKYIFFNDSLADGGEDGTRLPVSLAADMRERLARERDDRRDGHALRAFMLLSGYGKVIRDPFYFNVGSAFHSRIPCLEICDGTISLKLLGHDADQRIDFETWVRRVDLDDYDVRSRVMANRDRE